jgi:hypothetical protein
MNKAEQIKNLEASIQENALQKFDATCVKSRSNLGKNARQYNFDYPTFSPKKLLNDTPLCSPKLVSLIAKIRELDNADMKKYGKFFKHFIFSDLKTGNVGTKLIASYMIANGYTLGYSAELKEKYRYLLEKEESIHSDSESDSDSDSNSDNDDDSLDQRGGAEVEPPKNIYEKIALIPDNELQRTKNKNFYLLCSSGVYDQSITVATKKEILRRFNERPDNIQGENVRFIVMDSGYKEGIDLFDIKYIHIFEPTPITADQKQIVGRGTRTCGQKGLDFHPTRGWPLKVFIYDLEIPDKLKYGLGGSQTGLELYLKAMNLDVRLLNFTHELEKLSVFGSVDYELNRNVHLFSIPSEGSDDSIEEELPEGGEFVYGGTVTKLRRTLRLRRDLPPIVVNSQNNGIQIVLPDGLELSPEREPMNFEEMREHVRRNFSQYEWEPVKMENLCIEQKGGGRVLQYTPTQDFVRHYFTPQNPLKGLLLHHSTGAGKTCTAIATATSTFEKQGYTILWVTRTTLKADIWKNMFEQVCNEGIREQIVNNDLQIPAENKKRMKLVSKAWRIRPMSYKQFSNLVAKQNAFYNNLVKINGEEDPLRKTLIIIDEVHKLYGGDLSALEQPDMTAFHKALMNSYIVSGNQSVKIILMSATPITKDPMEMIKLLNLCRKSEDQLPTNFDLFREQYLDNEGHFTDDGEKKYLDKIAGYISYLNREKDARQFSQPEIYKVSVPIVPDVNLVETFDKKAVKQYMESDRVKLAEELKEKVEEMKKETNVTAKDFEYLKDKCDDSGSPQLNKECKKIVNQNIRQLVSEAKSEMNAMKDTVKEIRKLIRERNELRKTVFGKISENRENDEEEYKNYKNSLYYQLKSKCAKSLKTTNAHKNEMYSTDDELIEWSNLIEAYDAKIKELQNSLKDDTESYKNRILYIKKLLRTNLNELERSVVKSVLRDERKTMRVISRQKNKDVKNETNALKTQIKTTQKKCQKKYAKLRKTLKKHISDEKKELRKIESEEKKAKRQIDRENGRLSQMDERLETLTGFYSAKIDREIEGARRNIEYGEEQKREQKLQKEREKERKEQDRATRKALKDAKKTARETKKNKK